MANPKTKSAKKSPPRKRRTPSADLPLKAVQHEALSDNVAESLWILLAILGSPPLADEVKAARDTFQRLGPSPKEELRVIGGQLVRGLQGIQRLLRRELDSGTRQS